jgi:hypothetical protein
MLEQGIQQLRPALHNSRTRTTSAPGPKLPRQGFQHPRTIGRRFQQFQCSMVPCKGRFVVQMRRGKAQEWSYMAQDRIDNGLAR